MIAFLLCSAMQAFIKSAASWVLPPPSPILSPLSLLSTRSLVSLSWLLLASCMPALIPLDKTLGALFLSTVLSSTCVAVCNTLSQDLIEPEPDRPFSVYGVTWLQVYSYYDRYSSRDLWPLKSFVSASMWFVPCSRSYLSLCRSPFWCIHFRKLRYPIHNSDIIFELGSLIRSTWVSLFMGLMILASQIMGIICPSNVCNGIFPYVCVASHSVSWNLQQQPSL